MLEFKVDDKVLIDCSHEPNFGSNVMHGQIVLICNWPLGTRDKHGCTHEPELPL